jgi:hypothetical protein
VSFSAFALFVHRLNPLFLQQRQRLFPSPHWWLEREEGRPLRPSQYNDWMRGEFHYLARLLCGPLHWWGACDIAHSPDGRFLAFRLTPIAGVLFNKLPPDEQENEKVGNVQALSTLLEAVDGEQVLVSSCSQAWHIIELLETFTECAGVRAGRLCYRFTPRALSEALSKGQRPSFLIEFLQYSVTQMPGSASSLLHLMPLLERWIAGYGRVRIYKGATLLETADTQVMRELYATTSLEKQVTQALQPTLLIIKKTGAETVIDDLKRRGQAPLLHDEDSYAAE